MNGGQVHVAMKRSLSNATAAIGQPNKLQAADQHNADIESSSIGANRTNAKPPSMQLITGSVAQTVHWHRKHTQLDGLYEIFGRVLRIVAGPATQTHRVLLLRDDPEDAGGWGKSSVANQCKPLVLPAHYYEIDFKLPADVEAGSPVRCVGRFTASARFQVYKCRRVAEPGLDADGTPQAIGGALVSRLASLTNYMLLDDQTGRMKPTKKVVVAAGGRN